MSPDHAKCNSSCQNQKHFLALLQHMLLKNWKVATNEENGAIPMETTSHSTTHPEGTTNKTHNNHSNNNNNNSH